MTIDQRLRSATNHLEEAINGEPPPLPKRSLARPTALIGGLVVAGGGLMLLQDNSVTPEPSIVVDVGATGIDEAAVTTTEASTTTQPETPPSTEPALVALAADPPTGWTLIRATRLGPVPGGDTAGAIDLTIRPEDGLPIGKRATIDVSVQTALYRNPAEAEPLTIGGQPATIFVDDSLTTLVWQEDSATSVVITAFGYDRDVVVAVAEGLVVDAEQGSAVAVVVPDGSLVLATDEIAQPSASLLYQHDDGSEVRVLTMALERPLVEADRQALRGSGDQNFSFLERAEGVGLGFVAHETEQVMDWWTNDGLVLSLQGAGDSVSYDSLADLAASFVEVTDAEWLAEGGQ